MKQFMAKRIIRIIIKERKELTNRKSKINTAMKAAFDVSRPIINPSLQFHLSFTSSLTHRKLSDSKSTSGSARNPNTSVAEWNATGSVAMPSSLLASCDDTRKSWAAQRAAIDHPTAWRHHASACAHVLTFQTTWPRSFCTASLCRSQGRPVSLAALICNASMFSKNKMLVDMTARKARFPPLRTQRSNAGPKLGS